jgi:hypothetical protein
MSSIAGLRFCVDRSSAHVSQLIFWQCASIRSEHEQGTADVALAAP